MRMCITHITYIHKHTFVSRRNTISLCHTEEHLQYHCLLYQSALIKKNIPHTGDSFWKLPRENTVVPLGARQNYCRRPFHSKYPNSPHQASTEGPSMHGVGIDRSLSSLPMGKHGTEFCANTMPLMQSKDCKGSTLQNQNWQKKMASLRAFKFRHNTICFFPQLNKKTSLSQLFCSHVSHILIWLQKPTQSNIEP